MRFPLWQAGVLFCGVLSFWYLVIPFEWFAIRDDGVITLSHAKNWVEYGFIGVNPSGERIEAFSSPLQFAIFSAIYWLTSMNYAHFMLLQTLLLAGVVGSLICQLLQRDTIRTLCAFAIIAGYFPFVQWHGSGMENPWTHALVLLTLTLLIWQYQHQRIWFFSIVFLFVATLTRIESVYHIAPLLWIFAEVWRRRYQSWQGYQYAMVIGVCWFIFQGFRYHYFGDWQPNTAYAQNLKLSDRLMGLAQGDAEIWFATILAIFLIFWNSGVIYPILALVLGKLGRWKMKWNFPEYLLFSLLLTASLNPILFGFTRLDPARSVSFLILISVIFTLRLAWSFPLIAQVLVFLMGGALTLFVDSILVKKDMAFHQTFHSKYLCCSVQPFLETYRMVKTLSDQEGWHRPMVAVPDLGVFSWGKDFNILDSGRLGSSWMAKLQPEDRWVDVYLDHAKPEIISTHAPWTCRHLALYTDPRFLKQYMKVYDLPPIKAQQKCLESTNLDGIWLRRAMLRTSNDPERLFMETLHQNLGWEPIKMALATCEKRNECDAIVRRLYAYLPEIKQQGLYERVWMAREWQGYAQFLLNGSQNGQAHQSLLRD